MHALPPAPAPPARRQVLVGTAVASLGVVTLIGGMLAVYIRLREDVRSTGEPWVPESVTIPEVPTNVMLISFFALVVFAQWAVYVARRRDRAHIGLSLGLVGIVGLAIVNAQVYVYSQMQLPATDSEYATLFYAITATMTGLIVVGLVFTTVTAFRLLGGRESRPGDRHRPRPLLVRPHHRLLRAVAGRVRGEMMFPAGSRLLIGATVLAALAATLYGVTVGGSLGTIGLISAAVALAVLTVINLYTRDADVSALDEIALTDSPAAHRPPWPSLWPIVGALGGVLLAVGLVTYPVVFMLGIVALIAAVVEWTLQAWSERASGDRSYNTEVRERFAHPAEFPVLAALGFGVIVYSFSRIMLSLSKTGGPAAFGTIAALVLGAGFLVAFRRNLGNAVIAGVAAVAVLALVAGGIAAAISGERRDPRPRDDRRRRRRGRVHRRGGGGRRERRAQRRRQGQPVRRGDPA